MALNITYEKSALATFLDQLPQMLLQYKQMEYEKGDKQRERDFAQSQLFLTAALNEKAAVKERLYDARVKAREAGLVIETLDKIDDESQTDQSSQVLVETSLEAIKNQTASDEDRLALVNKNLGEFERGRQYGEILDLDFTGSVSKEEIAGYIKKQGPDFDESFMMTPAFKHGLDNYVHTPEKQLALEAGKADLAVRKYEAAVAAAKTAFIPRLVQTEVEMGEIGLAIKEEDLIALQKQQKIIEEHAKQAVQTTSLNEIKLLQEEVNLKNLDYEWGMKSFNETNKTLVQLQVNNVQAQAAVATNLFSNMKLALDTGGVISNINLVPFSTILKAEPGTEPGQLQKYLEHIGSDVHFSLIGEDIASLIQGYGLGKTEELIPDYTFVLDKMIDIKQDYNVYADWITKNQELFPLGVANTTYDHFRRVLTRQASSKFDEAISGIDAPVSQDEFTAILKTIQWQRTGLLDDIDALDNAGTTVKQFREIQNAQEEALMKHVEYQLSVNLPVQDEIIDQYLAPFTQRSQFTIDDIFNTNTQD